MNDALYEWTSSVNTSANDASNLESDVDRLRHELADLVHTIRDLETARWDGREDYEVLENARQLQSSVTSSVSALRNSIQDTAREVSEARRVVDFFRR